MATSAANWFQLKDTSGLVSPSLLLYPDRVKANLEKMLRAVKDPNRLRPHIKTHKMEAIVKMKLQMGIVKFKCATIAEAEMLGRCEAPDVLLAMQAVGAQLQRFATLVKKFPATRFSTLVDNTHSLEQLAATGIKPEVFLDLNTGMNRTGISPGEEALELYRSIDRNPNVEARGLHFYDGHVRDSDPVKRKEACDRGFQQMIDLKRKIEDSEIPVPAMIAGGSPTFPFHSGRYGVECSPGTTVLWDIRSASDLKDMDYEIAAVLFCRVLSKPAPDIISVDLGHKAVAPEMPFPRVKFLNIEGGNQISHSEEHLVIRTGEAAKLTPGTPCYAAPVHICPTVAKYPWAFTVVNGEITGKWYVTARDHVLSF